MQFRLSRCVPIVLIGVLLFSTTLTHAFKVDTHRRINDDVTVRNINNFSLDVYLRTQLGFGDGTGQFIKDLRVRQWIEEAGASEDCCLRFLHHFHNPLLPWNQSGFTGTFSSSVLWSQTPLGTQSLLGNWSWHDARDFFYEGLTHPDPEVRDKNLALTFRMEASVVLEAVIQEGV